MNCKSQESVHADIGTRESIDMSRRRSLCQLSSAAAAIWVTGCARIPIAQQAYLAWTAPTSRSDAYPVTAGTIADSPYASMGVQFEGQPKVIMTLATISQGDRLNWVSNNYVVLTTRDEMLMSTKGLPVDLDEIDANGATPVRSLEPGQTAGWQSARRQRSGVPGRTHGWVEVQSRYQNHGEEKVEVLGTMRDLWLIEEIADYREWRWQVTNRYWVDPESRFAWRSRQQFTPEVAAVTLEILKPYG